MDKETMQQIKAINNVRECLELERKAKEKGDMIRAKQIRYRMYELSIGNLKTQEQCDSFVKNAINNNRPDLAVAARRRSIELSVKRYPRYNDLHEVEKESLEALFAYEEVLKFKNGKKTKAAGTWKAIRNRGIIGAIDTLVSRPSDAAGFKVLKQMGLENYSFEAIVLKFPNSFSSEAINQAQIRMDTLLEDDK